MPVDSTRPADSGDPADSAGSDGSGDPEDSELAAYGQAVDVAVHVPTLSAAVATGAVAAGVWVWRQLRRSRAAAG